MHAHLYQDVLPQFKNLGVVGQGTFGKVMKCRNLNNRKIVAVKILTTSPAVYAEVRNLKILFTEDADEWNFARPFECHIYRNLTFLVFEMLDMSLADFCKNNDYRPLALKSIRVILIQVLTALQKLKEMGYMHADLKLQNLMLVEHNSQPFRIKVIDFGTMRASAQTKYPTSLYQPPFYMQSRWFRAPEVMLGLPVCEDIDMWSLGCIAAELFLHPGRGLYPGLSEYDMIRFIVQTQGIPPEGMLNAAIKTDRYFCQSAGRGNPFWRLKTPYEFERDTNIKPIETRKYIFNHLDDMARVNVPTDLIGDDLRAELSDRNEFFNILQKMLTLDPELRIEPMQALSHDFCNLTHLLGYSHTTNVKESVESLNVCWEYKRRWELNIKSYQVSNVMELASSRSIS